MSRSVVLAAAVLCLSAAPALAQDRSSVPQLTSAATDTRPIGQEPAPPSATVGQLNPNTAGREVPTRERPTVESRRAPTIAPETVSRALRVSNPPPEAVDRCEAASAGRAPPPPGLDCASVLEAAAFARRSPEERLLASEDIARPADGALVANGRVIPSASLVAQRLATGDVANSPVAQAVAAGFGARPADAGTTMTITDPDGTASTVVIPPDGGQ